MATSDISSKGCEFDYWEIIAPAMQAADVMDNKNAKTLTELPVSNE
ncbi:hypothetical protein E2C01_013620 [Portunus trituberculatus]|uniref:Uncharacterized protein n=1 Tax=Portunus trituberculatus TaxID=210409 RepID=A0A5B7DHS1_PORTR|nr:hypothetical protein [Portunus trituberculatus]